MARLRFGPLFPLAFLAACATPGFGSGTTTTLRPSEGVEVRVGGRNSEILVRTDGPGQLQLIQKDPLAVETRLGVPGVMTLRGPITFHLHNVSTMNASVAITVQGADAFELHPCGDAHAPAGR